MRILKFFGSLLAVLAFAAIAGVVWFYLAPAVSTYKIVETAIKAPAEGLTESGVPKTVQTGDAPEKFIAPEILAPAKKIISTPAAELPELAPSQVAGNGALTRAGIVDETNKQRQKYLGAGHDLKENSYLDIAAAAKAKDMLGGQYFEHVSPRGLGAEHFVKQANYSYIAIGENLARGNYESDAVLVQAWMDSPGHRENILKDGYKEIGVAAVYGTFEGKKTWLAVQIFAVPESACPAVDQNLAARIESAQASLDSFENELSALAAKIDDEKNQARILENELNAMVASRASRPRIKEKESELTRLVTAINEDVGEYNLRAAQAKTLYGGYQADIGSYNSQVAAYNACLSALQ